ncbi:unnamed protein product [Dicrocoelium dendriticum]|nr:unnamed protein product [Dicrocoelium dendriticum]
MPQGRTSIMIPTSAEVSEVTRTTHESKRSVEPANDLIELANRPPLRTPDNQDHRGPTDNGIEMSWSRRQLDVMPLDIQSRQKYRQKRATSACPLSSRSDISRSVDASPQFDISGHDTEPTLSMSCELITTTENRVM